MGTSNRWNDVAQSVEELIPVIDRVFEAWAQVPSYPVNPLVFGTVLHKAPQAVVLAYARMEPLDDQLQILRHHAKSAYALWKLLKPAECPQYDELVTAGRYQGCSYVELMIALGLKLAMTANSKAPTAEIQADLAADHQSWRKLRLKVRLELRTNSGREQAIDEEIGVDFTSYQSRAYWLKLFRSRGLEMSESAYLRQIKALGGERHPHNVRLVRFPVAALEQIMPPV